jgi:hypothetical protein
MTARERPELLTRMGQFPELDATIFTSAASSKVREKPRKNNRNRSSFTWCPHAE